MADEFDWDNAGPLVVREARDTVVYKNKDGDVVIRQRASWSDDQDAGIFIPIHRVQALIKQLEHLLADDPES